MLLHEAEHGRAAGRPHRGNANDECAFRSSTCKCASGRAASVLARCGCAGCASARPKSTRPTGRWGSDVTAVGQWPVECGSLSVAQAVQMRRSSSGELTESLQGTRLRRDGRHLRVRALEPPQGQLPRVSGRRWLWLACQCARHRRSLAHRLASTRRSGICGSAIATRPAAAAMPVCSARPPHVLDVRRWRMLGFGPQARHPSPEVVSPCWLGSTRVACAPEARTQALWRKVV